MKRAGWLAGLAIVLALLVVLSRLERPRLPASTPDREIGAVMERLLALRGIDPAPG